MPESLRDATVLDDPVRAALGDRHAHLALREGRAWRYPPDIGPFMTLPADASHDDWEDAAALLGTAGGAALLRTVDDIPAGWPEPQQMELLQMVATVALGRPDPELIELGPADVPDMLDLVERTVPGPFGARTIELGTYLGLRDGGDLVAMAGERLSGHGWTEVSAVCTDPAYRGRGLAGRLIRAVADGIEARGDGVFLHSRPGNAGAIRLYEALGFVTRRRLTGYRVTSPHQSNSRVQK